MSTEARVWVGEPIGGGSPRGLFVFAHGANQVGHWHQEGSGGDKKVYWDRCLELGYRCVAVKSPGEAWEVDRGNAEHEYVQGIVDGVGRGLERYYVGFSSGTGVASMCGFLDPLSRGVVLLGAGGRLEGAKVSGRVLPVYCGHGGSDTKVLVGDRDLHVERWRNETSASVMYEVYKRVTHQVSWRYVEPSLVWMGVAG
jgi:hypothetical protein